MKLLELTDYRGNDAKEYVEVDDIARIESRVVYSFFGSAKVVGARVFMKGGSRAPTSVLETPDQIIKMIKNKQFVNLGE